MGVWNGVPLDFVWMHRVPSRHLLGFPPLAPLA